MKQQKRKRKEKTPSLSLLLLPTHFEAANTRHITAPTSSPNLQQNATPYRRCIGGYARIENATTPAPPTATVSDVLVTSRQSPSLASGSERATAPLPRDAQGVEVA